MNQEKELNFVANSNYQYLQGASIPNYAPVPNYAPSDGSLSSRLINTKMVRIRILQKCVWSDLTCNKSYFHVNTISTIDDLNPNNENESPLFEVELYMPCCPEPVKFIFIDNQTRQPFSISQYKDMGQRVTSCCGENYFIFPDMLHYKNNNPNDICITKCYDTRSFYRTFEYNGQTFYKIGEPYVPNDKCCENCCGCCRNPDFKLKDESCCEECCKQVPIEKRTYADIFNMSGQCVGKYVQYFYQTGCFCCMEPTLFFEIYFPPDANEMLKLSLIGHFIFLLQLGPHIFGALPGSKDNLSMFINPTNNL